MNQEQVLNNRLERYERLIEISRDLASTLQLDALLERIIQAAVEISQSAAASILLYDETTRQLYFQIATNMGPSLPRGLNVPLEGSIAGWAIANRQSVIVSDAHRDPRFFDKVEKTTQLRTTSLIAVPLITKERVLGVLEVINKQAGDYSASDLEMLEVLGTQASIAIENTRLFQQSDLISELVHEIRTPLSSLTTASYLLLRPEISPEQRESMVSTIYSETNRLNELATSFLDLARLESGRAGFQLTMVSLPELVDECVLVVKPEAEQNRVRITSVVPENLPMLEADRGKIKQVVLNLLTNAIKYNRPGGSIDIRYQASAGDIALEVQDTGLGIPAEAIPHLFEKFYRVRGIEKSIPGTGLGLSITRSIVEGHRGRIEVLSREGEGSTFTIYLPLRGGGTQAQ